MGPAFLRLDGAHAAVAAIAERLVCGDIAALKPGQLRYTLLLNEQGGVLDDLMIGRPAEPERTGELYLVVNAGTKEADFALIGQAAAGGAALERADDGALIALQGPEAAAVLCAVLPGAERLGFMSFAAFDWQGARLLASRSGYTGEDGFEMLVPASHGRAFWDALLADERVRPVGLGARDSLRLEAGLPLYGHDLEPGVSPIEAGLAFAVSRRRREAADFPGAARILTELLSGPPRVRAGLLVEGAPAREGALVLAEDGAPVGHVTSGGFSPTLGRPIALAFVEPRLATPGTRLSALVRDRAQPAVVTPLPFVPHRYVRQP
jgi:aminomethyltransferase